MPVIEGKIPTYISYMFFVVNFKMSVRNKDIWLDVSLERNISYVSQKCQGILCVELGRGGD